MTTVLPYGPQNITFNKSMLDSKTSQFITFRFQEKKIINLNDITLHWSIYDHPIDNAPYCFLKSVRMYNDAGNNNLEYKFNRYMSNENWSCITGHSDLGLKNLSYESYGDEFINVTLEIQGYTHDRYNDNSITHDNLKLKYYATTIKDAVNPARTVRCMEIKASNYNPYNFQMLFNRSHGNYLEKIIIETPDKIEHKFFNKNLLEGDYSYSRVCSCDTFFYVYFLK